MAFNPFYPQNPYQYQPQYQQPYNGYQQPYSGYQNNNHQIQMQQPQQNTQQSIPGQMVDSLDTAKAKDIDMSGTPRYYPNLNGQEIYMKQLQSDGTCSTVVYKRVVPEQPVQNDQPTEMYAEAFDRIFGELDAIKAMISEPKVKGGAKA